MDDPYNLQRFLDSQESCFTQVCLELGAGQKSSHWMWFVFPQIQGLGHSELARKFAIVSLEEAKAYLHHAVLGERLAECTRLVNAVEGRSIEQIFGYPDCMKFQSSMTLFSCAATGSTVFNEALQKYFDDRLDDATLEHLKLRGDL